MKGDSQKRLVQRVSMMALIVANGDPSRAADIVAEYKMANDVMQQEASRNPQLPLSASEEREGFSAIMADSAAKSDIGQS